jgi:hypothetical protein
VPNFIVSYDLNGSKPSHAEMDKHLGQLGSSWARILETVWYVGADETLETVYAHVAEILSGNDRLFVALATDAAWDNLLVGDESLTSAWQSSR